MSLSKKRHFRLSHPDPSEDQLQTSIANLLDAILDPDQVRWSHFPSGGYYLSPAAKARLYRLGLKPGFPDLVLCYGNGQTLWLEVKTPTGHLSPSQRSMHLRFAALHHHIRVVRSVEDVIKALLEYRVPHRKARMDGEYYAAATQQGAATCATKEPAQSNSGLGQPREAEVMARGQPSYVQN